jgi:hypothetical protein
VCVGESAAHVLDILVVSRAFWESSSPERASIARVLYAKFGLCDIFRQDDEPKMVPVAFTALGESPAVRFISWCIKYFAGRSITGGAVALEVTTHGDSIFHARRPSRRTRPGLPGRSNKKIHRRGGCSGFQRWPSSVHASCRVPNDQSTPSAACRCPNEVTFSILTSAKAPSGCNTQSFFGLVLPA